MYNRSRKEGKHDDDEGEAEDPPGDGRKEPAADRGARRAAEEARVMQTAGGYGPRHFPLLELYCYDKMGGDDMDGIQISFFDAEISDEEKRLRKILKRGSGYEGGPLRIYAAEKLLDTDRFAMFLADEFNVGGHSVTLEGFRGFCDYNGRGMIIREWKTGLEWKYNWKKIAGIYRDMISMGEFPDYSVITLYEEARKAGKGAPAPRMHYWGGDR